MDKLREIIREEIHSILLELSDAKVVKLSKEKSKLENELKKLQQKFQGTKNRTADFMKAYINNYKKVRAEFEKVNVEYLNALKDFEKTLLTIGHGEIA